MLDVTEDARKALSCVFRVEQRFGMGHVIDVLRGAKTERLLHLGHDRLSTYGIGAGNSQEHWGAVLRHLVHLGFLEQDVGQYSILRLTAAAKPLLRGEQTLTMAAPRPQPLGSGGKGPRKKGRKASLTDFADLLRSKRAKPHLQKAPHLSGDTLATTTTGATRRAGTTDQPKEQQGLEEDRILFDRLRALRKKLADEMGVPPFVVFSDASLIDMVARRPHTPAEFLGIHGVGAAKLERYGSVFLKEIEQFEAESLTEC
jgi:ATP-dependent DNA helicase RecQ